MRCGHGLHWGDLLFPRLFILVSDVLSRILHRASQEHLLWRLGLDEVLEGIRSLQFSDDLLIFF